MQVTASLPRQLILRSMFITSYLVESLGDIWLVVRKFWVPSKRIHFTTQFSVFKLDFQLRQWIDVHNRSDCAFAETVKIEPPPIWLFTNKQIIRATSALAEVVGCCPHNACEGSGSSPHKSIVGAKYSLYPSLLRNASGVWTSSPVRGYLYWACTS
ncbi:hypothetical protein CICLE_v10023887mg [Citrus x clementina]|uniref:Uncharacterized protein n=1 Tax=Citrus clementina TaxID=85681 RepID=V4TTU1_CITCL|nr:hypothetical protein CICLE_v10023887mg [Citrus x clementina]